MSFSVLMQRWLLAALMLLTLVPPAFADDFLDPEQAFKLDVQMAGDRAVQLNFQIAPGYYMYREQFKVEAPGASLGEVRWPAGKRKFDETFQKEVETYRDRLSVTVPVTAVPSAPLRLRLTGQGCADKGLCYPPMTSEIRIGLTAFGGDGRIQIAAAADAMSGFGLSRAVAAPTSNADSQAPSKIGSGLIDGDRTSASGMTGNSSAAADAGTSSGNGLPAPPRSSSDGDTNPPGATPSPTNATGGALDEVLASGRLWLILGAFFLAGLLLSLTPCVLPMLPILSSIIAGQGGRTTRLRGLLLAFSYSLGMALLYTALGVGAGLAGGGLAAYLQKPWVLTLFALLLVAFSLSMFGVYELQLPSRFTGGLSEATQRLPAGKFFSVFAMGALSALIVSPCVAAPLAGALVYISQTRDVFLGGAALFALAWGMSVPLLLLGVSAGTLLPKAGPWMESVKYFFGLLLLAVALWIVQPVLPPVAAQLLWGALLVGFAGLLGLFHGSEPHAPRTWLRKSVGLAALVFGLAQFVGVAAGGTDPLQPLRGLALGQGGGASPSNAAAVSFKKIRSVAELDEALRTAGKPVMLDFYADWCVSCKEMERFTFTDARVQARLAGALLLKADVTANSEDDRALLKRFKLFGPPGTIFFDPAGQELPGARVIGFQDADRFLQSLTTAGI